MVTARSLNKRSTTILIAVVLAAGTGLLLFNYLSTVAHTAQAAPMRSVVIATHEIPARTVVRPDMVTIADRPEDSVDPDVSTSLGAVVGEMAFIDIPSGSTLSASKIGHLEIGGLTMRVPVGQRAMSIALDPVKGVADLVQAGDHVDVIAVTQPRGNTDAPRAVTILRNKVVLAMGTTMEVPAAAAGSAAADASNTSSSAAQTAIQTATLAITPQEARVLALADLNATLRLALRSPRDTNHAETGDAFVMSAPPETRVAVAAAPAQPAPVRMPAPVQHHAPPGIPMIDGDQVIR
jgi:pilus assembly protein CpaB